MHTKQFEKQGPQKTPENELVIYISRAMERQFCRPIPSVRWETKKRHTKKKNSCTRRGLIKRRRLKEERNKEITRLGTIIFITNPVVAVLSYSSSGASVYTTGSYT